MTRGPLLERSTTEAIIGAFYEVYNTLGYGFLENVYSLALAQELVDRGHIVSREVVIFGPKAKFLRVIQSRRRPNKV